MMHGEGYSEGFGHRGQYGMNLVGGCRAVVTEFVGEFLEEHISPQIRGVGHGYHGLTDAG